MTKNTTPEFALRVAHQVRVNARKAAKCMLWTSAVAALVSSALLFVYIREFLAVGGTWEIFVRHPSLWYAPLFAAISYLVGADAVLSNLSIRWNGFVPRFTLRVLP